MEVQIGNKKFKIKAVSLYISDLYIDFIRARNEGMTVEAEFEEARIECEIETAEAETKADKLRAELKLFRRARDIKKSSVDYASTALIKRNEIIKELVELNGYEWDESLWLKGFSESQFSDLVDELLGGKKKAE